VVLVRLLSDHNPHQLCQHVLNVRRISDSQPLNQCCIIIVDGIIVVFIMVLTPWIYLSITSVVYITWLFSVVMVSYKEAYYILMEYWDSLPDEEKPDIDKRLIKLGL